MYGSSSPLARVPTKLDLMPAVQGYLHDIGWVRTELPYQLWQASLALRHGLAPRPLLSRMTWTYTPRVWASSNALAIGAEVKR